MKMTFTELRRRPESLLKALEGGQVATLSRRGKDIARITPLEVNGVRIAARDHKAFGMWADRQDLPIRWSRCGTFAIHDNNGYLLPFGETVTVA